MNCVLVTGGFGYIGSHVVVKLLRNCCKVIVLDNLSNSSIDRLGEINVLCKDFMENFSYVIGDICNNSTLDSLFEQADVNCVMHFAGLKSVPDSIADPETYYKNNVEGTSTLLKAMKTNGIKNFIFSSSATVYGTNCAPFTEDMSIGIGITNPYGQTKCDVENMLSCVTDMNIWSLRYFNPIGCASGGMLRDVPTKLSTGLMATIQRVLDGNESMLHICGSDYPTSDGSPVRDYIHVEDLADAHICAMNNMKPGFNALNVGTGVGTTVLELIDIVSKVNGVVVPHVIGDRRHGDVAIMYCDCAKANKLIDWTPVRNLTSACNLYL